MNPKLCGRRRTAPVCIYCQLLSDKQPHGPPPHIERGPNTPNTHTTKLIPSNRIFVCSQIQPSKARSSALQPTRMLNGRENSTSLHPDARVLNPLHVTGSTSSSKPVASCHHKPCQDLASAGWGLEPNPLTSDLGFHLISSSILSTPPCAREASPPPAHLPPAPCPAHP